MSGPHDRPIGMTPLDQFDPNYAVYESQYTGMQRNVGPSTSYEGFGFWYRPDHQESIYNPDPALLDQARSIQTPAMDVQLALKHKRTRSGCFTCRHRRVKCDETKPICDRCRKGNRQCEFPSKTSSAKKVKATDTTNPTTDRETAENEGLPESIKEESEDEASDPDESDSSPRNQQSRPNPQQSLATSHFSTDSSDKSNASPIEPLTRSNTVQTLPWKELKPEIQRYLQFQRDHMTHYHYCFKVDPKDFVHEELITLAMQFKPLLYAVVAFAAYHYTVRLPDDDADFNAFWKYYCKSIIKLRQFLESSKERNDLVILTVLQLATFEEYMGDWSNLVSHHKAACGILISKYTPQTIMETDRGRKIFDWYIRLDVIAGLMAVRDASLDRSWIAYAYEWHEQKSSSTGHGYLQRKCDFFTKGIELIAHDTAHLFARVSEAQGALELGREVGFSIEDISLEVQKLSERLDKLRQQIQQVHDPSFTRVDSNVAHDPKDTVFASNVPLFRGPLWSLNFVWVDWYGVSMLLRNSMLAVLQKTLGSLHPHAQPPSSMEHLQHQALAILPELTRYSKVQCEIYNAICASATAPAGVCLVCSISVGLSTVFLPRAPPEENSGYTLWARQQLANIERQGYVWPPHFRKEMANLWGIPEIEDWWLPNGEGKIRILDEIRAVVSDRNRIAQQKERPGQDQGRDLREIKGLFEMMDLGRRASVDALSVSSRLDSSYASSSAGIANAASMVSSPESSAGSTSGLTSPRGSISDAHVGTIQSRHRQQSRSSVAGSTSESPIVYSKPAPPGNNMSDDWEEQRR